VDRTYDQLKKEAEAAGYHLTADIAFAKELITGLLTNEARYGYRACPCRLAAGDKTEDLDIICPVITAIRTLRNTGLFLLPLCL